MPTTRSTSLRIVFVSPMAADSDISGISSVDTACKNDDGKKMIGRAIPFSRPKISMPLLVSFVNIDRHFGTIRFSAVRSPLVRYLPVAIGVAIFKMDFVPQCEKLVCFSAVLIVFLLFIKQK